MNLDRQWMGLRQMKRWQVGQRTDSMNGAGSRRASWLVGCIALLGCILSSSICRGELILVPTGPGSVVLRDYELDPEDLFDPNTYDNVFAGRSLGFTGEFFGQSKTTVDVSSNGNLNFTNNSSFFPVGGASSVARISPLWEDLFVPAADLNDPAQITGGKIIERVGAGGSYYSVTWLLAPKYLDFTPMPISLQVIWFGAVQTIGQFVFQPNDIAFSFDVGPLGLGELASVVGLDKGDNNLFVALPGDIVDPGDINNRNDGYIDEIEGASLLPLNPGSFMLFRPDGAGSYDASIQSTSAVPEPSTLGLALLSMTVGGGIMRARKWLRSRTKSPSNT